MIGVSLVLAKKALIVATLPSKSSVRHEVLTVGECLRELL
jgi:hypothetical protein